ncbi:MAG: hypothetical protein HDQ97_00080 [Lachnospiraceae bacterium]|nr:hypothetical protein [Lachnospiraceae bacterium]
MALSAFLNVNGYDYPCPRYGFQYVLSTPVNAGRNVNAAFIGQRVNRDLYKFDSLQWVGLDPSVRRMILQSLEPFTVPVTFEDYRTGNPITITMYPGDRTGKPLFADELTHMVTKDEILAFNLVDCGW